MINSRNSLFETISPVLQSLVMTAGAKHVVIPSETFECCEVFTDSHMTENRERAATLGYYRRG